MSNVFGGSAMLFKSAHFLTILFASIFVTGCIGPFARPVPIRTLLDSAAKYDGMSVTVLGVVESPIKLPFIAARLYQIRDSTGTIPVVLYSGSLPTEGTTLAVTGNLRVTAILGSQTFGPHIAVGQSAPNP